MKKTRRILAWLLALALVISGVNQFGLKQAIAEETTESYKVFVAFGGDKYDDGDWGYQYYGTDGVNGTEGITATTAEISEGETVTVGLEFATPAKYAWFVAPTMVAEGVVSTDFDVKVLVDGEEVNVDLTAGDNFWYEATGDYDDTQAVRIAGGYNEWGTKYIEAQSDFSKIEFVITANSIQVKETKDDNTEDDDSKDGDIVESTESYDAFIAFGGDDVKEGNWDLQYYGGEKTPDRVTVENGTISVGKTTTITMSFDNPVIKAWFYAPVMVAENVVSADFTIKEYIDGKEVEINTEAGDQWWYEGTGDYDDTQTIRLAGGYNEWGTQYVEEPSGFTEIKFVITANSIKVTESKDDDTKDNEITESTESYDAFIAFGGDDVNAGNWDLQYYGGEKTPDRVTVENGTISVGETTTITMSFDNPVIKAWFYAPVIVAENVVSADFTIKEYIDGEEVEINTEAGDQWWYEGTGDYDDTQAIRLAGGYNEWGTQYVEEPSGFTEIKFVITANSIKVKQDNQEEPDEDTDDGAVATAITALKYEVEISDSEGVSEFTWVSYDSNWNEKTAVVEAKDGEAEFGNLYNNADGLYKPGYTDDVKGTNLKIKINKVVVNNKYEMYFDDEMIIRDGANGITDAYVKGLEDRTKIYSTEDGTAYVAYDAEKGYMRLFVVPEEDNIVDTRDPKIAQAYVKAMGNGWNLGNSFDGVNTNEDEEDLGEIAWGNPTVTKELIQEVEKKGYSSIRIPMTLMRRYYVNDDAADGEYKYVIDKDWLARYKEVVDWAVEDGLYVMINIHHDSWGWLANWDGDTSSEEYRMYTDFWSQIADYFKDEPAQVCFETINEPYFEDTCLIPYQERLDAINEAAYEIIRGIPENKERMIVMPTLSTNHEAANSAPLVNLIKKLNDSYVIATVHYYSAWVYSANLGITSFDEDLYPTDGIEYSARDYVDTLMDTLNEQFTDNGISVIIGEYGLLGYDAYDGCLQTGEELKYYEYVNAKAAENNVCIMFWDNGSGIDRNDTAYYSWKNELVGDMLEASMKGRSSYSTGLNTLYYNGKATEDAKIPLTLNGNTFTGITGLTQGTDYTYDAATATVTLKKDYINNVLTTGGKLRSQGDGTVADLEFTFSSGADWHQYIVKYSAASYGEPTGSTEDKNGVEIPVEFNGRQIKCITAYQGDSKVGPNSSWWDYLQNGGSFKVDYDNGTLNILHDFFKNDQTGEVFAKAGLTKFVIQYYDGGTSDTIYMNVGEEETTSPQVQWLDLGTICLYLGETEIPSQYINATENYSIDVIEGLLDSGMASKVGDKLKFDTNTYEFEEAVLSLTSGDIVNERTVSVGIKNAPAVDDASVKTGATTKLAVSNLADDAVLTYSVADSSIATVASDGTVTGVKAGKTKVTVTVSQYGRTDSFEGEITVTADAVTTQAPSTEATTSTQAPTTATPGANGSITEVPAANVTTTEAPAADATSPTTGDSSPIVVVAIAMMLSGIAFVILRRKSRETEE